MGKNPLRVAIFGAMYGAYCLVPAFQRDPRVVVAAICAPTAKRRDAAAKRYDIPETCSSVEEVLDRVGIQAAAIAVPPDQQEEIAFTCLSRKIPVFSEKPLGANLASAKSLAQTAHKNGIITAVDFLFPELPLWQEAKRLLSGEEIGPLQHVIVNWVVESYDNQHGITGWKTDGNLGGGVMSHFGSHMLHYLEWFCGPITSLNATLGRPPRYHSSGDTLATLAATFDSGVSASATLCSAAPFGTGHRIDFYGKNGVLSLVNNTTGYLDFRLHIQLTGDAKMQDINIPDPDSDLPEGVDPRVAPVSRLVRRFVNAIETGDKMHPSFDEGLRVQFHLDQISKMTEFNQTIDNGFLPGGQ